MSKPPPHPPTISSVVDALAPAELGMLLRAVRTHRSLLSNSIKDLERRGETGSAPAYILDYELLHKYLFDRTDLEAVVELDYIFDRIDTDLFLGSGTLLEFEQKVHETTGIDFSLVRIHEPTYESLQKVSWSNFARLEAKLEDIVLKDPGGVVALARFRGLLQDGRLRPVVEELANKQTHVRELFETCLKILSTLRNKPNSNLADALNLSEALALRELALAGKADTWGFYLSTTGTLHQPAFDDLQDALFLDRRITRDFVRDPLAAIHCERVLSAYSNLETAMTHAKDLLRHVGVVESLLPDPGELEDQAEFVRHKWEDLVPKNLSPKVRREFGRLDKFVGDELVLEMQRILDTATAPHAVDYLRDRASQEAETTQQLFDLIAGIAKAIPDYAYADFADLWSRMITLSTQTGPTLRTFSFCGPGRGNVYLEIERHDDNYWVFRWPTRSDPETTLNLFEHAFRDHEIDRAHLTVGTGNGVAFFDAEFPISMGDIVEAVAESIEWIRLDAGTLALYTEIRPNTSTPPVLGVIVTDPIPHHLAGLYSATSSRFIFTPWLYSMLAKAGLKD